MRKVIAAPLLFLLLFYSCTHSNSPESEKRSEVISTQKSEGARYLDNCDSLRREARKMDSLLLNEIEVVKATADRAILAFTGFALHCVSDTMCPVYLIKTAQVARAVNNIPQAKAALDRCIDTYPGFVQRPAAIFLLAQLYDEATYLNNEQEARKWYQKIIEEYPKSEWAPAAQSAIKLLGKTDEEIIREFTKKNNKEKS